MTQIQPRERAFGVDYRGYEAGRMELLEKAGFAHELGNLIQIVSSAMNIVARNARLRNAADLEPVIAGARTSLDRAGSLVRQTMRQASKSEADFQEVEVALCLSDIEAVVQCTWPPEARVKVRIEADLPMVKCDPLGLHNTVLNLALNARDAMPNGGDIVIAAEAILAREAGVIVQISVTDTGVGMTADTIVRAFDPFFTTKSTGLGGLGLPMVRRFVQEVGGSVNIESKPGVGTRVILLLPASRQNSRQQAGFVNRA